MRIPTVKSARIRFHSPELECDVSRRIGWYVQREDGERGRIHKTRQEATLEASAKPDTKGETP